MGLYRKNSRKNSRKANRKNSRKNSRKANRRQRGGAMMGETSMSPGDFPGAVMGSIPKIPNTPMYQESGPQVGGARKQHKTSKMAAAYRAALKAMKKTRANNRKNSRRASRRNNNENIGVGI